MAPNYANKVVGKSSLLGEKEPRHMKYAIIIARVLLGLVFAVFGSNAFLHFIPMPPTAARRRWRLHRRTHAQRLPVCCRNSSSPRWIMFALRSLCPPRPDVARTGDLQHLVLSHILRSERHADRDHHLNPRALSPLGLSRQVPSHLPAVRCRLFPAEKIRLGQPCQLC